MAAYAINSPEGQQWWPWFGDIFTEGRDVPADLSTQLVLRLAAGDADALSGRFLSIHDDLVALVARAEEIRHHDGYTLRLRTLP